MFQEEERSSEKALHQERGGRGEEKGHTGSRETTFTHAKNKGDAQSRNFHKELDVFL